MACLILKVLLEDIPRHGPGLAEELRRAGAEIKAAAEKELAEFYPVDPDGARPIAYLWARTVRCESSGCGAEIPLARSFWLSKKASRRRALRYRVERPKGQPPEVVLELHFLPGYAPELNPDEFVWHHLNHLFEHCLYREVIDRSWPQEKQIATFLESQAPYVALLKDGRYESMLEREAGTRVIIRQLFLQSVERGQGMKRRGEGS